MRTRYAPGAIRDAGVARADQRIAELEAGIQDFDKVVTCLAIQLPEAVWNDVVGRWRNVYKLLKAQP